MTTVSLADMAQSFALRRHGTALKAEQQKLSTEMTTGLVADAGRHLRGDLRELSAIDASLSRLEAYKGSVTSATLVAEGMQSVLASIGRLSTSLATTLSEPLTSGTPSGVGAAMAEAGGGFSAVISLLNTEIAGQPLFAGAAASGPALADAETILAELEAVTAGIDTAPELEAAVKAWFDDPEGFAATAWRGEGTRAAMAVGPGDSVTLDMTALDPALRDTLRALATGALADRGTLAGNEAERAALATGIGAALTAGRDALVGMQGRIGGVEARLSAIGTRNEAEASALSIARNDLVAADPYETAVRFEAVNTQIETLYSVTSRLSRLSLVDFL